MKENSQGARGAHVRMDESAADAQTMLRQQEKKKKKYRAIFIVALVVFLGSLIALGAIIYQYWAQDKAYSDLEANVQVDTNASLADLTVDWDALQTINPNIVAWIYIPDTPVNYPVVQGSDNEEYLHKAFDGTTGWLASAGTIFLDASNNPEFKDQNNALYGHHMNNGSMFASLADWVDNDEFNSHRDIYLLTPRGNYRLKTFAVVVTTGSDAIVQTKFASEEDFQNYIQDKLDRSRVTQEKTVLKASDVKQAFLLSTCEYTNRDGRSVAFASVVETTVPDDPYVASTAQGSTGLSRDESKTIGEDYQEAA